MSADITTLGMAVDSTGVKKASDDLDQMTKIGNYAAMSVGEVEKAMTRATIAGEVIGESIGKVVVKTFDLVKGFLELGLEVGHYQDIAERIGSNDPAGLASLRTAADVAGTSVDTVAASINRMALQLKNADESKVAGKALAAINIEVEEFKKLDPVAQYRALAVALGTFADSQKKVQILQAVTGRGGADQLVMMHELASETEKSNHLTNEQIRLADELTDKAKRSRSEMRQYAEVLAVNFLPAIEVLSVAMKAAIGDLLGLSDNTKDFANRKELVEYGFSAATALGFIIDAGDGIGRSFRIVGEVIGANMAMLDQINHFEFGAAMNTLGELRKTVMNIVDEKLFSTRIEAAINAARARMAAGVQDPAKPEIGEVDLTNDKKTKSIKDQRDQYTELINSLNEKLGLQQQEVELGRKQSADEKLAMDTMDTLNKFKKAATEAQFENVAAILENIAAQRKLNEENVAASKALQALFSIQNQIGAEAERNAVGAEREALAAENQLAIYGMSADALEALDVANKRRRASELLAQKAIEDAKGQTTRYSAALGMEADALLRAADAQEKLNRQQQQERKDPLKGAESAVKSYLEKISEAGTATKDVVTNAVEGLEDALTQLGAKGKTDIRSLIDYMIAEFWRLKIVRPILNDIFGGGASGSGGLGGIGDLIKQGIGWLFGSGGGEAAIGNMGADSIKPGAASGGSIEAGQTKQVNERGPELATFGGKTFLMAGSQGGNITPAERSGVGNSISVTIAPTINIDSRSDAGQVAELVRGAITESQAAMIEELKAQGVV